MVTRILAYSGSKRVEASSFNREGYFSTRLSISHAQQYPFNQEEVLDLAFTDLSKTRPLPHRLKYSLIGEDVASFMGEMSVFTSKQLKGKNVIAVIGRSEKEVVAIIPSLDVI